MALAGLPMSLAPMLGPTIGGVLVDYISWRAIFLINIPVGVANLVLATLLLKESHKRPDLSLDRPGLLLTVIAFPAVLFGLGEGEASGWTSPLVLSLLATGIVAVSLLVVVEIRSENPLLPMRLFRYPMFGLGMTLQEVMQFSLFGMGFLIPLLLQAGFGLSAAQTGLLLLPSGIITFIAMNTGGRLYNRVGPRPLVLSGMTVLLVITLLLSRTTAATAVGVVGAFFVHEVVLDRMKQARKQQAAEDSR